MTSETAEASHLSALVSRDTSTAAAETIDVNRERTKREKVKNDMTE